MVSKFGISFSKGPFSGSMLIFRGCIPFCIWIPVTPCHFWALGFLDSHPRRHTFMWRVPLLRLGNGGMGWVDQLFQLSFKDVLGTLKLWVVVDSNIFGIFTPKLGVSWSNLTSIFQRGWNHQLVTYEVFVPFYFFLKLAMIECGWNVHIISKNQDIFLWCARFFYIHFLKPTIFRCCVSFNQSKIEWDLTNGPPSKLLEILDT